MAVYLVDSERAKDLRLDIKILGQLTDPKTRQEFISSVARNLMKSERLRMDLNEEQVNVTWPPEGGEKNV